MSSPTPCANPFPSGSVTLALDAPHTDAPGACEKWWYRRRRPLDGILEPGGFRLSVLTRPRTVHQPVLLVRPATEAQRV